MEREIPHPVELVDAINLETTEMVALLKMLRVFCRMEDREMGPGDELEGTLSDAAEGLSIMMSDLSNRVESIKKKADQLYELLGRTASAGGSR